MGHLAFCHSDWHIASDCYTIHCTVEEDLFRASEANAGGAEGGVPPHPRLFAITRGMPITVCRLSAELVLNDFP